MPPERVRHRLAGLALLLAIGVAPGGCGGEEAAAPRVGPTYDAAGRALVPVARPERRPNLVLVVVDALRHDALPADEEPPQAARMPHLASLGSQGVVFENAVAAAPWTLPSMTSLLTGMQPSEHGLHTPRSRARLLADITTFAEILETTYGYDTAAFTAGPWFIGEGASILQGFEHQVAEFGLHGAKPALWQWAWPRNRGRPFFLLLHTYDVHHPYGASNHDGSVQARPEVTADPSLFGPEADEAAIFRRCFLDQAATFALRDAMGQAALANLLHRYQHLDYARDPRPALAAELEGAYWRGARWEDGLLAETTTWLRRQGLLKDTLLVVTSDHGECFGEHGALAHGLQLYDELVRVPLVMLGPPPFQGGRRVTSSIGLVDVLPTFLDWAGFAPQTGVEGRSRLALLEDDMGCRPVVSEERLSILNTGVPGEALRFSVRTEQLKYLLTWDLESGEVGEEVYDLLIDPDEVDDLAGGTGRLPDGLVFDDCFCEAVERVRARVWTRTAPQDERTATPSGPTSAEGPRTRPPPPCRAQS